MIKITFHNGEFIETKELPNATQADSLGSTVDLKTPEFELVFSCCASRFIYLEVINKEE